MQCSRSIQRGAYSKVVERSVSIQHFTQYLFQVHCQQCTALCQLEICPDHLQAMEHLSHAKPHEAKESPMQCMFLSSSVGMIYCQETRSSWFPSGVEWKESHNYHDTYFTHKNIKCDNLNLILCALSGTGVIPSVSM